jgi:hypothetical protein
MVGRVLLGKRGTEYGLWITKPGKEVQTATLDSDFLLRVDTKMVQVVQSGVIPQTAGGFTPTVVNIPNLGFKPVVEFESVGWYEVVCQYLSWTQIYFIQSPNGGDGSLGNRFTPAGSAAQRYIRYRVWSLPAVA